MLVSYAHLLIMNKKFLKTPQRTLQSIIIGFKIIGTALILILMLQKQTNLVLALRRLKSFDKKMSQLGSSPSYYVHNLFIIFGCIFIFFTSVLYLFALYYFLNQNITQILCFIFSQGYHFIIIAICVLYLDYFCFILGRKILFVVNLTKKLPQNNRKQSLSNLVLISEMYTDLYKATRHFNRMISIPILVLTLSNILGAIAILYLIYHKEEDIMDCITLGLYALQVCTTLLPPMYIKTNVSQKKCVSDGL